MRIGVDIREIENSNITGIGRYLENILEYVNKFDNKNQYILFATKEVNSVKRFNNLELKVIKGNNSFIWEQISLPHWLKQEKIDIFFSPYYKRPLFISCRSIITIHDLNPLFLKSSSIKEWIKNKIYFPLIIGKSIAKADKIITVSQFSKNDIIKKFKTASEKIEVVYNSVNERYHRTTIGLEKIAAKYGITKKFIFYFGNFNYHKNVARIIEAYSKLSGDIKNEFQLALGGNKDRQHKQLQNMVENLQLKEKVIFTGIIDEFDLADMYSEAELFVFISLREGFGLPPLEAMACGTPIICSNSTALPEVVGNAAILVDPYNIDEIKDKMINVLKNTSLRQILIENGLARAAEFKPQNNICKIIKIFEDLGR